MDARRKLGNFARYAWFVVGYNVLVILWGVFLRASKSGDGCGQHWLTCHGEVVPSAPELKTVIEFSHRITSALAGIFVIILLVWAIRLWRRDKSYLTSQVLKTTVASFVFILIEGALGAGLVLTGNTAETLTPARPFWMGAHLINTLVLLTLLTMTAWSASTGRLVQLRGNSGQAKWVAAGTLLLFAVGVTGSIAALSSMIFPSGTITEGIAKDFSPTSHTLLRLRVLHPIVAVASAVFLVFWTGWLKRTFAADLRVVRWANVLASLTIAQIAFGAMTLLTLGPIVMQLGHLLLADAMWIAFVLLSLNLMCVDVFEVQSLPRRQVSPAETIASSES
jgi:heme a synthase